MPTLHRVGFVRVGDFQIMSCAAVAAFAVANIFAGRKFYDVRALSERGGIARSSVGVAIETTRLSGLYDTLLVAGPTAIAPSSKRVLAYLRRRELSLFVEMHPSIWPTVGVTRTDLEAELRAQSLDIVPLIATSDVWTLEGLCVRLVPR